MPLFNKKEEGAEVKAPKKAPAKKAAAPKEAKTESMKDLYAGGASSKASEKKTRNNSAKLARANEVLVRPMVTEKVTDLNGLNKYVFEVSMGANKVEVSKAIEAVYGVKPVKVNIVRSEGKVKNYGRRTGKRKDWKKAIVSLAKGKTIDVYEGV